MLEPLLDRVRELERANRRWKALCVILATILLAVLVSGTAFMGVAGYRTLLNRQAVQAMEEARMQEVRARADAEVARQRAVEALKQAQERARRNR